MNKMNNVNMVSKVAASVFHGLLQPVLEALLAVPMLTLGREDWEPLFARVVDRCVHRVIYGPRRRCHAVTRRKNLCSRYAVTDWCRMHQRIHDREPTSPRPIRRCEGTTKRGSPCQRRLGARCAETRCHLHRLPSEKEEPVAEPAVEPVEELSIVEPAIVEPVDEEERLGAQLTTIRVKLQEIVAMGDREDAIYEIHAEAQREILILIGARNPREEEMAKLSEGVMQSMSLLRQKQRDFVEVYETAFQKLVDEELLPLGHRVLPYPALEQRLRFVVMWAKSQLPQIQERLKDLEAYLIDVLNEFDLYREKVRKHHQKMDKLKARRSRGSMRF